MALAVALVATAAAVTRSTNRRARERVTIACARLHATHGRVLEKMRPIVDMMADQPDRPAILALLAREPFADVCARLGPELADYRWNFGRRIDFPPSSEADRARVDAARAAMVRSIPRCRNVMSEQLKALDGLGPIPESERAQVLELCDFDRLRSKIVTRPPTDSSPTLLEDWPRLLENWADATERL